MFQNTLKKLAKKFQLKLKKKIPVNILTFHTNFKIIHRKFPAEFKLKRAYLSKF